MYCIYMYVYLFSQWTLYKTWRFGSPVLLVRRDHGNFFILNTWKCLQPKVKMNMRYNVQYVSASPFPSPRNKIIHVSAQNNQNAILGQFGRPFSVFDSTEQELYMWQD